MSATCRSCGARVFFAKSGAREGKRMILNEAPVTDGNVVLFRRTEGLVAIVLKRGEEPADPLASRYKDHHATCPRVKEWRPR